MISKVKLPAYKAGHRREFAQEGVCNPFLAPTPLSIGGGIGQSRTYMLLLKKAHIEEVSATVWPKIIKDMCKKKNINVLE